MKPSAPLNPSIYHSTQCVTTSVTKTHVLTETNKFQTNSTPYTHVTEQNAPIPLVTWPPTFLLEIFSLINKLPPKHFPKTHNLYPNWKSYQTLSLPYSNPITIFSSQSFKPIFILTVNHNELLCFIPSNPSVSKNHPIFHILDSHMSANSNILHHPEITNITLNKFPFISLKQLQFSTTSLFYCRQLPITSQKSLQINSKPTHLQTQTSSNSFSLHFFIDHYNLLTYLMLKIKEEYWNSRGRKEVTNKNKQ